MKAKAMEVAFWAVVAIVVIGVYAYIGKPIIAAADKSRAEAAN